MFSLFGNKSEEISGCDPRTEPISISNMNIPDIKVVYLDVVVIETLGSLLKSLDESCSFFSS